MLNVNQDYYRLFYYVCRYRSLTKAANILQMSQPNMTRGLNRLEAQLGCKLLVRSTRGVTLTPEGEALYATGRLRSGVYTLPGNVSSQFISGLLMALPRLPGDSRLTVTGTLESAGYVAMTEDALAESGIRWQRTGQVWSIPGGQRFHLPRLCRVEGDWSNAAFFLCAGAVSWRGITVEGL